MNLNTFSLILFFTLLKSQYFIGSEQTFFLSSNHDISYLNHQFTLSKSSDTFFSLIRLNYLENYKFSIEAQKLEVIFPETALLRNIGGISLKKDIYSIRNPLDFKFESQAPRFNYSLGGSYFLLDHSYEKPRFEKINNNYFFQSSSISTREKVLFLSPAISFKNLENIIFEMGLKNIPLHLNRKNSTDSFNGSKEFLLKLFFKNTIQTSYQKSLYTLAWRKLQNKKRYKVKFENYLDEHFYTLSFGYGSYIFNGLDFRLSYTYSSQELESLNRTQFLRLLQKYKRQYFDETHAFKVSLNYKFSTKKSPSITLLGFYSHTKNIFLFKRNSYQYKPFASLDLRNPSPIRKKFLISVIDTETKNIFYQRFVTLKAMQEKRINLFLYLSDFYLMEKKNKRLSISIGEDYKLIQQTEITLFPKNRWNSNLKDLSYFIKKEDPRMSDIIRKLFTQIVYRKENSFQQLTTFLSISSDSIRYLQDPLNSESTEFVQTAYETLTRKTGDCEDLAVFYINQLRQIGYNASLIAIKKLDQKDSQYGHIMLLINTKINPEEASTYGFNEFNSIQKKNRFNEVKLWIPIESTILNKGLEKAHKKASELYYKYAIIKQGLKNKNVELVDFF